MGPPSYMRSVVDRNVVTRRVPVQMKYLNTATCFDLVCCIVSLFYATYHLKGFPPFSVLQSSIIFTISAISSSCWHSPLHLSHSDIFGCGQFRSHIWQTWEVLFSLNEILLPYVYNYVLLKMSTWFSKHVEENSILWINNNQCIKLVINV